MIWDPHSGDATAATIVSQICTELETAGAAGMLLPPGHIEELAQAVGYFLEEQGSGGAADSRYVVMLASKALSSLGECEQARRLFLFGTGLIRPSEWDVTGDDAMWVLDLRQMTVHSDASIELLFFCSLNIVLDSIAEVWDRTDGHGLLGLRHVCSAACALLGEPGAKKAVAPLVEEIKDLCRRKLGQIGAERGWHDTPKVMNLDI